MKKKRTNTLQKSLIVLIFIISFTVGGFFAVAFSSLPTTPPDDRDLIIIYDTTNPLATVIAKDTYDILDDAYADEPYKLELLGIDNGEDLRQVMSKKAENIVYIFHGDESGMTVGQQLISWSTLGTWIKISPVENHYLMSCESENSYTNIPTKNVIGFEGIVDGLIAQTSVLAQLSRSLIPLNAEAAALAKNYVNYIIKGMSTDFLMRLMSPIDPLSTKDILRAVFGLGVFIDVEVGETKFKAQAHLYIGGFQYKYGWKYVFGSWEYFNGWYKYARGEIQLEWGVEGAYDGIQLCAEWYEKSTGEIIMDARVSVFRTWSKKFPHLKSVSIGVRVGLDLTFTFKYGRLTKFSITGFIELRGNIKLTKKVWFATITIFRFDLNVRLNLRLVFDFSDTGRYYIYQWGFGWGWRSRFSIQVWLGVKLTLRFLIAAVFDIRFSIDKWFNILAVTIYY